MPNTTQVPLPARLQSLAIPLDFHCASPAIPPTLPARAVIDGHPFVVVSALAGGVRSPYPVAALIRCDDQVWVQAARGHLVILEVLDADGALCSAPDFFSRVGARVGQVFNGSTVPARHAA